MGCSFWRKNLLGKTLKCKKIASDKSLCNWIYHKPQALQGISAKHRDLALLPNGDFNGGFSTVHLKKNSSDLALKCAAIGKLKRQA